MGRRSKSLIISDFAGGLNTDTSPTSLKINEAIDLDNIFILPSKTGFVKRNGNSAFNSSAMDSGASVHGLGYYRTVAGTEYMMTICGTKIFKSELDGTMDDITGAVTISSGQDNIWTYNQMNDLAIFVGGNRATNVPLKWNATGNAAVLGGTPPVGKWCVKANNRLFIANTVANPSRINWCTLGNPEDWSGAGSGSQDVSTNDGDELIGASLQGNDHLILFKQNSSHELIARTSPFPVFPLFDKVGAVGPNAIVNVDGIIYFITPHPRMLATDGKQIFNFPDNINSIWDGLSKSRLKYIYGIHDKVRRLILWFCSTANATSNDYCIVWDLENEVWLRFTTGHKMNVASVISDRYIYAGAYDGKVYLLDDQTTFNDASESTPTISAYFRSGWNDMDEMINSKHVPYSDFNFKTQTTGNFTFTYGYNFDSDRHSVQFNMQEAGAQWDSGTWDISKWSGKTDQTKITHMKGNGKFFQYMLKNANSGEQFQINRIAFPVNADAPSA